MSRRPLDRSMLENFKPRQDETMPVSGWQRRDAPEEGDREGQFTIRAKLSSIERFRKMCREDRRTYAAMLEILMDKYDESRGNGKT